jgi:hypothetical protein
MSGAGAHHDGLDPHADAGATWRALSGEPAATWAAPQPVEGGWQQAWQDEHGQWHAPYAQHVPVEQPPYPGASAALVELQPQPMPMPEPAPMQEPLPTFVAPQQLAPVGPPRYLAPQRPVRDPRQRTLAAVITFVALVIGLWGLLGFMGSLSKMLTSINSGNAKLKVQMTEANVGLADLNTKTDYLDAMAENTGTLQVALVGIDEDMGTMLGGVNEIATGMETLGTSLDTLDSELGQVNDINEGMSTQLASINAGLASQLRSVRTMRRDVVETGKVLGTLPGRLDATNGRLAYVNGSVNTMGCAGIMNNLKVKIGVGPLNTGSATVYATVVPPGTWGTKADGKTPC